MNQLTHAQQQQFQRIAKQIPCPSCAGQSVYDSDSFESLEIRAELMQSVQAGDDDLKIVSRLSKQTDVSMIRTDQILANFFLVMVMCCLIGVRVLRYYLKKYR